MTLKWNPCFFATEVPPSTLKAVNEVNDEPAMMTFLPVNSQRKPFLYKIERCLDDIYMYSIHRNAYQCYWGIRIKQSDWSIHTPFIIPWNDCQCQRWIGREQSDWSIHTPYIMPRSDCQCQRWIGSEQSDWSIYTPCIIPRSLIGHFISFFLNFLNHYFSFKYFSIYAFAARFHQNYQTSF